MPRTVDPSLIVTGAGSVVPGSVSPSAITPGAEDTSGIGAIVPASDVSIRGIFERYLAGNAEGAFGELAALVPPAPGGVGSAGVPWLGSTNTGVPDWGVLKLWDGALVLSSVNSPNTIYPYYWRAPLSNAGTGTDPVTDPTFNIIDGIYSGGGPGMAHAGFVTVSMAGNPADGYPSWRILPGTTPQVVVSGIASPADRGVVALVKWVAGDLSAPVPAANTTDITDRCLAALLLGQGISSSSGGCDGTPGGIFTVGSPTPYDFPGQAAGQYDLNEIHSGISRTLGPPPAADPAAGQVRLLTDPAAVSFSPGTIPGGMPIFGATSIATGGGTDGNFFAYRLPYLKDYSASSGIVYTPKTPFDETTRYFNTLPPAATPTTTQAGDYADFTENYWAIQIARYRHRFVLTAVGPGLTRDNSYALVHFRREQFFEEYIRDGIAPTADKLYSVTLVNWSGAAQIDNLVDLTLPAPTISPAYAVNASEVSEDPSAVTPALGGGDTYTLSVAGGSPLTTVSGVDYLIPRNPVTSGYNLGITDISAVISGVFAESYRSHDKLPTAGPLVGDTRFNALNQNPVFMSLSSFSYEGDENVTTPGTTISLGGALVSAALFPAVLGQVRRQRLEFGYADLRGGTTNPIPADNAVIGIGGFTIPTGIRFDGDANTPVFTENAKVRLFVRKSLNVDGGTGYPLPSDPAVGLELPSFVATKTLYHSMKEINAGPIKPTYGNAITPANAVFNATKDREERFLDEVYRYPVTWEPLATTIPADAAQLIGPGLPGGVAPVLVPVRPVSGDPDYTGYYFLGYPVRLLDGTDPLVANEAQVAGLPERNAPYTDGLDAPFPSRGVLLYPKDDYSSGYNPVGPDYSVATGDREYVRVFDQGAANVGASSAVFRLWGVTLSDFAYVGPTPGGVGLVVLLKIPGLTTWMDVGRVDGGGPSKQDPAVDGAGCLVTGLNTFDAIDPASQIQFAQVEVNIGPLAAFFLNGEGKCPVLMKIILKDNATGKALDWQNVAPTAVTSTCRGLVGIEW